MGPHNPYFILSMKVTIQGFSQTHKIEKIAIIGNFVFPYICSFLLYLQNIMLVNVKLMLVDFRGLHFKSVNLIGFVHFKCQKVGNIGILLL